MYGRDMAKEPDKDPRLITPISQNLLDRIEDFRFETRSPSRSEAVRVLLEAGLAAKKSEKKEAR